MSVFDDEKIIVQAIRDELTATALVHRNTTENDIYRSNERNKPNGEHISIAVKNINTNSNHDCDDEILTFYVNFYYKNDRRSLGMATEFKDRFYQFSFNDSLVCHSIKIIAVGVEVTKGLYMCQVSFKVHT